MLEKNGNLKKALYESEFTQEQVAAKIGMNRASLSMLCMGRLIPTELEKEKLSRILNVPVSKLFNRV